jgi:uncharacterized caspase-like protein
MNKLLLLLLSAIILFANNDRALYLKKYKNEKKVALVIGNSDYSGKLSKLKNPINDANDVKDQLENLGFEVIIVTNADQKRIDRKLREFVTKLKTAGVGLFYFAGHGLSVDNQNYLIPLKADINDKYSVKYGSLAVNEVVDRMKNSKTRLNMLILDACRNDPFSRGGGGLSSMPNAKGTLIAYATSAGDVAKDNVGGRNGLYTKHFLKYLKSSNLNQREFFHKIRQGVYNESKKDQLPYLNDGTIGDFYFKVDTNINYTKPKQPTIEKNYETRKTINNNIISSRVWKDEQTKLLWQNEPFSNEDVKSYHDRKKSIRVLNWEDANNYCKNLNIDGIDTFRLPTIKELDTLWVSKYDRPNTKYKTNRVNSGNMRQNIYTVSHKGDKFTYTYFWSSTKKDLNYNSIDLTYLYNIAKRNDHSKRKLNYVICVSSEDVKHQNPKDIWEDKQTNLIWQNQPINFEDEVNYKYKRQKGRVLNWYAAKDYCKNLVLNDISDWRLPSLLELKSLSNVKLFNNSQYKNYSKEQREAKDDWLDKNKHKANGSYFIKKKMNTRGIPPSVWASTIATKKMMFGLLSRKDDNSAWSVNFHGAIDHVKKSDSNYVMCVSGSKK